MPYLERVEMPQRPWLDHYPSDVDPVLQDVTLPHVPALARQAASTYANTIAFTQVMANGMNGSLKYREVDVHSDNFAAYLRETLGLQQGDRVAVQIPNSLAYPIVAFGVMKAGLVLVNTNPLYTASEMTHQFKDSGAKVLVVSDMFELDCSRRRRLLNVVQHTRGFTIRQVRRFYVISHATSHRRAAYIRSHPTYCTGQ